MPDAKLTDYLLSDTHPQGRSKAAFFRRLGFQREDTDRLRRVLLELATTTDMIETVFAFGVKYTGVGDFVMPSGERVRLRTVWVIREIGSAPVFVTAYPA